jgi:hypothetical protein
MHKVDNIDFVCQVIIFYLLFFIFYFQNKNFIKNKNIKFLKLFLGKNSKLVIVVYTWS